MKILVAGVGGIGGWLACTLARGGADVTLYARGLTLARLREDGLTLLSGDMRETFRLPVWDGRETLAPQDVVLICTKAQDVGDIAANIAQAFQQAFQNAPRVSAVVNGLPWWFLQGMSAPLKTTHLDRIDPGGKATKLFAGIRPIGSVVHASAHSVEPGVVRIAKQDRFILGDPDGAASSETKELSRLCEAGGLSSPVVDDIRKEIWIKLWGNMSVNPLSALTRLSTGPLHEIAETRALIVSLMEEFDAVGRKLGLTLPMTIEERIGVTQLLGDFRPSMLVDVELGRRLEIEAMLGCIVEIAGLLGIDIPASRVVYALTKGLDFKLSQAAKT